MVTKVVGWVLGQGGRLFGGLCDGRMALASMAEGKFGLGVIAFLHAPST